MKNMKIIYASILLSCVSNSWQAYAMEPHTIAMSIGQECPLGKIFELPDLRHFKSAKKLTEQGANSTIYKWNDHIIKISKIVAPAEELSEKLDDLQKTYTVLSKLKSPGFDFALPQKTYRIKSSDNKGMCFVEISKALPEEHKINKHFYEYIDINRDNRVLFFDLGRKLAQLQKSITPTLENDGFYYGVQHGDFQIGNIFYDCNTRTFTLIDLGDFAEHKRLILDPLYFVYFFSNSFGREGVSNQEHFIERLEDENFKSKMSNMITAFITGYVSNLNPDVAEHMNKVIQEKVNLTDVFYSGSKFLYGEGEDIISGQENDSENLKEARKKIIDFLNQIIREAFATAFIKSLTQLPNLCKADTVKLDLSLYPNLEDLTGLGQCKNLKELYLQNTKVSDIEEIGKLTNLEELDLSSSHVGWILPLAGYTLVHGSPIKSNPGCHKLKLLKLYGIKEVHGYYQLENELPNLTIKTSANTEKY